MSDVSTITTPQDQPARAGDGTLLNQASTESTQTDSSATKVEPTSTTAETSKEKTPSPDSQKETTPSDKSLLNAKPEGAPEKYADFKLPEGLTLKPEALTEVQALFKGLNLPQEAAQSLVDFHAKQLSDAAQAPFKAVTDTKTKWEGEVRAEFGKDIEPGGKVNVAIARVIDAMPKELSAGFREAMDHTLAGSNPAFVRAFAWIANQFSEGTTVKGNGPSPLGQKSANTPPPSIAAAMYPHLKSGATQS